MQYKDDPENNICDNAALYNVANFFLLQICVRWLIAFNYNSHKINTT
jgi:hypothetical protein